MMEFDVTDELLILCGLSQERAALFREPLSLALPRFGINTPRRFAGFMSQAGHESRNFEHLQENLFYSKPERILEVFGRERVGGGLDAATKLTRNPRALASRVYSSKRPDDMAATMGNGDEASGDGWNYSGKGPFQLTWKNNYARAKLVIGIDYVANPELVLEPGHGTMCACAFWNWSDCNRMADSLDILGMTRRVNGPRLLGFLDRSRRFDNIYNALRGVSA
jgi:putative chitinase